MRLFPYMLVLFFLQGAVCCGSSRAVQAQSSRDALTPAEVEQIREATDLPAERVKLYMRFLNEHSATIAELNHKQLVEHKGLKLHDAIEQFTKLTDEMQNNLDEYEGYQTNARRPVPDLRKVLPELQKAITVWHDTLAALPHDPDYDFALETSNEAVASLKDQTAEMIPSQTQYFIEKKKKDKEQEKIKEKGGYVAP